MSASYDAITAFAAAHHAAHTPITIAPLPPDLPLQTHHTTLGLPARALHAALLHALSRPAHDALAASFILLLAAPEHHTAANTRRRALLGDRALLRQELAVLESLLTSPLPKHTKSPTLWTLRRWVWAQLDTRPDVLRELRVVFAAGEAHYGNYYAFEYARWLLRVYAPAELAPDVLDAVQTWAGAHVSDPSAWSFWAWCVKRAAPEERGRRVRQVMRESREVVGGHVAFWAAVRGVMGEREVEMLRGWVREMEGRERVGKEEELQKWCAAWVEKWGIWDGERKEEAACAELERA